MTRHAFQMSGLALGGLGLLVAAAAQAQTDASAVDCASFLAMGEGQMNSVAALVEAQVDAGLTAPEEIDPQVLLDAGIDPAAGVALPAPLPGETLRVMKEACARVPDANVVDALTAGQTGAAAPVGSGG